MTLQLTTNHPSPSGQSQCAKILEQLQNRRGQWVPMPMLGAASGSLAVHSRISDLRGEGHIIEQRSKRRGRATHSSYRMP